MLPPSAGGAGGGPLAELGSQVAAASPEQQAAAAEGLTMAMNGMQQVYSAASQGDFEAASDAGRRVTQGVAQADAAIPGMKEPLGAMLRQAALSNPFSGGAPGSTPAQLRANAEVMANMSSLFPKDDVLRDQYAKSLLAAGDYPASAREASQAAEQYPEAYSTLSRAQYRMGDYSGARESARAALKSDPRNAHAGSVLRLTDGRTGPRDGQSASLAKDMSPETGTSASASAFRPFQPSRASRPPKYLGSAESDLGSRSDLAQKARRLLQEGDAAGALRAAEQALRLDPYNATARYYMVMSLIRQGRLEEALAAASGGLRLSPEDARLLAARSKALNMLGRHAEALADAEASLRLRRDSAEGFIGKAWALDAMGRREEALAALAAAAALDPKYKDLSARAASFKPGELARLLAGETSGKTGPEQAAAAEQAPAGRGLPAFALAVVIGALLGLVVLAGIRRARNRA